MKELQVEKTYWASVSGGKDSLKMLHIILENPQKSGNMNRNIKVRGQTTRNILIMFWNMFIKSGYHFCMKN